MFEGEESGPRPRPPLFVSEHLSSCPECAAFARSLESLGAGLQEAMNSRLSSLPPPWIDEVLLREAARLRPSEEQRRDDHGPAWARRLRWAAVPVAAAVLAAVLGPILVRQAGTRRLVRQEITLFVDRLYAEPLLEGVESALDGGPEGLQLLDEARRDVDSWLGGGDALH
jgi:hypothetical protein